MKSKFLKATALAMAITGVFLSQNAISAPRMFNTYSVNPKTDPSQSLNDTGVAFTTGQLVDVVASGYVSPVGQMTIRSNIVSPLGFKSGGGEVSDCNLYSLVGRIGPTGTWHCIGKKLTFYAEKNGNLELYFNDQLGDFADNVGAHVALITIP